MELPIWGSRWESPSSAVDWLPLPPHLFSVNQTVLLFYSLSRLILAKHKEAFASIKHISYENAHSFQLSSIFMLKSSYDLNRLKSHYVIRATDGLLVRCWTNTLGNLTGASSNPAKGFHFSNQNEAVDFIFSAES